MIYSVAAKTEARLDSKFGTRLDAVETSVGTLESTITTEFRSFKEEMKIWRALKRLDETTTTVNELRKELDELKKGS